MKREEALEIVRDWSTLPYVEVLKKHKKIFPEDWIMKNAEKVDKLKEQFKITEEELKQ